MVGEGKARGESGSQAQEKQNGAVSFVLCRGGGGGVSDQSVQRSAGCYLSCLTDPPTSNTPPVPGGG